MGTKAGPFARWMLRGRKTKHWMRMIYALQSVWKLKRSVRGSFSYKDYLQAGKSVAGIHDGRAGGGDRAAVPGGGGVQPVQPVQPSGQRRAPRRTVKACSSGETPLEQSLLPSLCFDSMRRQRCPEIP